MPKTLVVIPAHNEEETIREVVTRSLRYADVSVTDDGSRDQTPAILREIQSECAAGIHPHRLNVITHENATHIPRGVQDGMRWGVEQGYDFIITMDAGLSHDPDALPGFIAADPNVDLVIGTRTEVENVPFYRKVISWMGARVVNFALARSWWDVRGPGIRDCTGGFRRYSRRAADRVASAELRSKAFDFHMESLALVIRAGMSFSEIPIRYVFSNSSFNSKVLRLAMQFGWHLIETKEGLKSRHVFLFALAYYVIVVVAASARYEFQPTALLHLGHYYIEQNAAHVPDGVVRFIGNEENGGNGYDGQIFFFFADTLLTKNVWPDGFNNAYRAPRIGYPLLVSPFSLIGPAGTAYGMILVQLGLLAGAAAALVRMLPKESKWMVMLFVLSPFQLQSFSVLVSDSVMVSLVVIGLMFWKEERIVPAWVFFSLALLTKESSLFILFPLGLTALWRRQWTASVSIVAVLFPMLGWQFYLSQAHGMLPAKTLGTFLSPLDGIIGVARETWTLLAGLASQRTSAAAVSLLKHSAKLLLIAALIAAIYAALPRAKKPLRSQVDNALPYVPAALLAALSILVADYYYFWGIFENVGRMFTLLVPVLILLKSSTPNARTAPFFAVCLVLTGLIWLRLLLLSPVFPHDTYHPYSGPSYAGHAPEPGRK